MTIKIFISILPVFFVIHLLITEYLLHRKGFKLDGTPPINKYIFFGSKYAVIVFWTAMILEIWNIFLIKDFNHYQLIETIGIGFWIVGFIFLYIGRFSLGQSFRIGISNEKTEFVIKGIYRISRNPMYLGLNFTLIGCMLYTLNIIYIIITMSIIIVHHIIAINEEKFLAESYGDVYINYCKTVRRYI